MPDESEDSSRDSDGEGTAEPAVTSDDPGSAEGDDPGSAEGDDARPVEGDDPGPANEFEATPDGGEAEDSDDSPDPPEPADPGGDEAEVGGDGTSGLQKVERDDEPGPPPDDAPADGGPPAEAEPPVDGDSSAETPPDTGEAPSPDGETGDDPSTDGEAGAERAADVDDGAESDDDSGLDDRGDGTVPESNVAFDEDEVADPVADPDVEVADPAADDAVVGPLPAEEADPEEGPSPPEPEEGPRPPEPEEGPPEPDDGPPGPGPDDATTVPPRDPDDPDEPTFGPPPEGPPDDEEMPLADHIEEMVGRLGVVVVAIAAATALAFPLAEEVLVAMWYDTLPAAASDPHIYGPLEKILAEIKVASLAGILVALPVLVYQSYLFMRPGLYPRERRYYLAAVPTSLVLGALGMAFAYFLVLPALFQYFVYYSRSGVDRLAFGLRVTFDLIVAMLGAFAVVFQIPLLIMLAIMMGVTSRQWLEDRRIYFWGGFVGLGFLMGGADLTGMAPIIIGATMIGLFEGTLLLLRWTDS